MSAAVTEEDQAAALAVYKDSLSVDCELRGVNEVNRLRIEVIAQAIADARERERKACYVDVCALRCAAHGGEDGCPCLAASEQAIAARRSK